VMVISVGIQISPNLNLPQKRYRLDRSSATGLFQSAAISDQHPFRNAATDSIPAATYTAGDGAFGYEASVGRCSLGTLCWNSLGTLLEME